MEKLGSLFHATGQPNLQYGASNFLYVVGRNEVASVKIGARLGNPLPRDQSARETLLYGRTDAGLRFVANGGADAATVARLTSENQIGARVKLRADRTLGTNRATFAD